MSAAKQIKHIDTVVAKRIGMLPKTFYKPFVWLGRLTTPALWASYLLLVQLVVSLGGEAARQGWVVIILLPLASLIKLFFRRTRPPTIYTESMRIKSYSFPSSHAYSAMLSACYLYAMSVHYGACWGGVVLGVALLIGVSRVYVGAHYPSDVVAGWLLGLTACVFAWQIV